MGKPELLVLVITVVELLDGRLIQKVPQNLIMLLLEARFMLLMVVSLGQLMRIVVI